MIAPVQRNKIFCKLSTFLKLFSDGADGSHMWIYSVGMDRKTCPICLTSASPRFASLVLMQSPQVIIGASISARVQWGLWISVGGPSPFPQLILPGHNWLVQRRTCGSTEPVSSFLRILDSVLSQSVWALTFKAPKLSVTLFSFMLTRNVTEAGLWGERTKQLCREEELRRATMESWVPDFSFSCRFKFVSMRIPSYHYNKMFFLFKLIGVGLLSLGIQCLNK